MKKLALIALIFTSSIYAQDQYFAETVYHEVDCSQKVYCEIKSYEDSLLWDREVGHDLVRESMHARNVYHAEYENNDRRVSIRFIPKDRELHVVESWGPEYLTLREYEDTSRSVDLLCKQTEEDQYFCRHFSR